MRARRIYVEKAPRFRVEAQSLLADFNENLSLGLKSLRLVNVYDLFGFSDALLEQCRYRVFGERVTDIVSDELPLDGQKWIAVEYLPGQFDQRASSAEDCVHLLAPEADIRIRSARLLIFPEETSEEALARVRHYFINPVESREKEMSRLCEAGGAAVRPLEDLSGFIRLEGDALEQFRLSHGLAMSRDDIEEVSRYFRSERRDPTETELRILDTYWSDHCRHTTFNTEIQSVRIGDSFMKEELEGLLGRFETIRAELGREGKPFCLMELATIGARYLSAKGLLEDMEKSEENNACSIFIDVDVDGRTEKWLLQFKNETHNHPTEIEPFGGASTCLGGAIRDPLSGRAYVYQAMRVTGAGDILASVADTLPGKLPQRVISRKAAAGYSSYGNQIGLATTHVREIYDAGYTAKRLEVGAVVGAVKASNVRRESPAPGDVILLLGGRTGKDGIGGATGSSKKHTEASLENCGSEVQKGNAPQERQLQRLFRRPEAARLIKKSNDFGAGGVSVAIGELAPGLEIWLDRVPVKYAGLNATELAISESQERMAVVVAASDREAFEALCAQDNIEVTHVATVTADARMRMFFRGEQVCDLSRAFIDSAGAIHRCEVEIQPVSDKAPFALRPEGATLQERLCTLLASPNVASQRGLVEMFDSTIGRSTVLMPYGGRTQETETQQSVQKLPVEGETDTASVLTFGYNPELSRWSPCHGAAYAVVEACAKTVACGAPWEKMRFSYQEYFERMASAQSWGKPLSALLGALKMQLDLGLPSIGGKDSMSGSFEQLNVPPTLIAFGVSTVRASRVISPEFKRAGNRIYLLSVPALPNYMPDTSALKAMWTALGKKIADGSVCSAWALGFGAVAEALVKMSMGNRLGFEVQVPEERLFRLDYGALLVEATQELDIPGALELGRVTAGEMRLNGESLVPELLFKANQGRYSGVYPVDVPPLFSAEPPCGAPAEAEIPAYPGEAVAKPLVCLPVFPGTNCDYDTAKAFRCAGAEPRPFIFRNLSAADVDASIEGLCRCIDESHILAFCGGFSSGDEPDGSGKFIADVIGNAAVSRSIDALLQRGGLVLGICNGFQALIKSGLLPYGKAGSVDVHSPTLFRNDINRHISRIARTEVVSVRSPWLAGMKPGQLHSVAFSHGEGKFVVEEEMARKLFAAGQVAFRYVDNPNGSYYDIEGIVSPDGRILGKMGHSERWEQGLYKNIDGDCCQNIFANAVNYFRKCKNGN